MASRPALVMWFMSLTWLTLRSSSLTWLTLRSSSFRSLVWRASLTPREEGESLSIPRPRLAWPGAAAAAALTAMVACSSSSSPMPPQLGSCTPTATAPCKSSLNGGGSSPQGDGGAAASEDAGVVANEAGSCPGAAEIFSAAGSSCASCVVANCCGAASCPSDPACTSIAVCVAQTCLANDASCLMTCESASAPDTTTEFLAFRQCVGASCPGCPAVGSGDL